MSYKVVLILFIVISYAEGKGYNTETYHVRAHKSRRLIDKVDTQYYVLNVGRPNVTVQIVWGDTYDWRGPLQSKDLEHGESHVFRLQKTRSFQAVNVINNGDENAFVHAFATRYGYPEYDNDDRKFFNIDSLDLAKSIVATGAAYVPFVGEILANIVDFFWPENEESVWDDIKDQISNLVDKRIQNTIEGILNGDLDQIRHRIKICSYEIEHPNITETIKTHYVNLVEDLLGFEKKFSLDVSDSVNVNFYLLAFYSAVINLKLRFYQYGIVNKDKIDLNDEHILRLKHYMFELLYDSQRGAIKHVHKVCDDKLDETYRETYPENIFDEMASVREFCALYGLEHIPVWKSIVKDPFGKKKPEIPVVVYSTQFGRNTARQSSEMVYPDYPSITPKLFNGTLNHPTEIWVFLTSSNKIGGFRITSADGSAVYVGPTITKKPKKIIFEGKKLMKLTARGTGQIDGLEFTFEGGRVEKAGTLTGDSRTFSLPSHHIVGLYATNSLLRVDRNQLANIAVSFQVIVNQSK